MTEPCRGALPTRAIVRLSGRDARSFLQAQATQNVDDLEPRESVLAAWLSARGRVRALFDVVPEGEDLCLVTQADNAGWLAAELTKFVLRAEVTIVLDTGRHVEAVIGDADAWLGERGIELAAHGVARQSNLVWLRIAPRRVDVIGRPDDLARALADLPSTSPDEAALAAIEAGRPAVPAALRDKYIPQMLNLDRLDAVSFSKGCYPGQEIAARTQNLGQVKRRIERFRVGTGTNPEPGDVIVDGDGNARGEINRAAAIEAGYVLLAVTGIDAPAAALTLERDGRALEPRPLT